MTVDDGKHDDDDDDDEEYKCDIHECHRRRDHILGYFTGRRGHWGQRGERVILRTCLESGWAPESGGGSDRDEEIVETLVEKVGHVWCDNMS